MTFPEMTRKSEFINIYQIIYRLFEVLMNHLPQISSVVKKYV